MELAYVVSDTAMGNMAFRYGDVADVSRNRAAFLASAGITPERCVVMQIEHADTVAPVGEGDCGKGALDPDSFVTGEALMTDKPGIGLFLLTADCLPVAYHDPVRGVVALAHLGWKPSAAGLAAKVVGEMQGVYGSDPRDLRVFIGPGIHKESYAFEHLDQATSPAWQAYLSQDTAGKWHVDLVGFNVAQLTAAGVLPEHIIVDTTDTAASPEYFSHYRAAQTGEPEGRFVTVVALRGSSGDTVQ